MAGKCNRLMASIRIESWSSES